MAGPIRTRIEIDADTRGAVEGLTDVEKAARDADEAVERLDAATVSIDVDDAALAKARQGIDDVGKSADSSKSVLANMVGNTTQDLGALGGVAGSAGVAIGQMGEYMADAAAQGEKLGSVVGNFAKVAGPVVALAAAVQIATAAWGAYQKNQQEAREEAEKMLKVQGELADQKFAEAAKTLADTYAGMFEDLAEQGVNATRAIQFITGATEDLGIEEEANRQIIEEHNTELTALLQRAIRARDTFADQNRELTDQRDLTNEIEDTLATIYGTITAQVPAWQQIDTAIDRARGNMDRFGADGVENMGAVEKATDDTTDAVDDLVASYDVLLGRLDQRRALRNAERAFEDVQAAAVEAFKAKGTEDATEKMRDFQDAIDDAIRSLTDAGAPADLIVAVTTLFDQGRIVEAAQIAQQRLDRMQLTVPLVIQPVLPNTSELARIIDAAGNVRIVGAPPARTFGGTPVGANVTIINPPGTPAATAGNLTIFTSRNGDR